MGWFSEYRTSLFLAGTIATTVLLSLVPGVEDAETLRWAHVYEIGSPYHQETLRAAEEFERRTEGRYRVRVYPASALGNESAINESLALGAIDVIYTGAAFVAKDYPPIALSDFPFALRDFEHWQAYRDSGLFRDLAAEYGKVSGTRVAGLTYYGFRHMTSDRPIRHPDDMRKLKIRVPNAPLYLILPRATGANATPIPFAEVYLALQQGVVDAQENPLTTIRFKRFHEVQTHISLTGHMAPSLLTVVSNRTLEHMSEADARLFLDVAWRAADRASRAIARSEEALVEWFLGQGVVVNSADREAFRQAVDEYFKERDYPFPRAYLERLAKLGKP